MAFTALRRDSLLLRQIECVPESALDVGTNRTNTLNLKFVFSVFNQHSASK